MLAKKPFFTFSFHPSISKTTALDFFSLLFCLDFGDLFSWFDTISNVTTSDVFSWLLSDKTVGGVWTLAWSLGTVFGRLFLSFFTTVIRAPETGVSMASLKFYNFIQLRSISMAFFWASIQEILRKHLRGFLSFGVLKLSFCIFKLSFDVFKLSFNCITE